MSPRAPAATASPAHRSTLGAPPSAVAPKATAAAAPLADPVGLPSATTPADASAPLLTTPTVREPGAPAPSSPASSSSALEGPAQQVVRAVAHAPGERVVEVRLDPPSLGRVRIEFDFSGDTVRAVVSAAEPETLSLLRRGGAGLARDLAELGYGEAEIEYAEDRSDRPDAWDDGPHAFALPAANAPALAATAAPLAVRLHDGALDITL